MKRFLVWLFTDALTLQVGRARYSPAWDAVGAVATAAAVVIALVAVWYSVRSLRQQLRHQLDLEAKHLEQDLLLRVMDVADAPYEASKMFVADIVIWQGGPQRNPEFFVAASKIVLEAHHRLSTATSTVLHVLRRSRPRRFPRGTIDQAFNTYYDLVQRVLQTNARLIEYMSGDIAKFQIAQFEKDVGSDAFQMSDLLRRYTGELLARMFSDDNEWSPINYGQSGEARPDGALPFDFMDKPPLGRNR